MQRQKENYNELLVWEQQNLRFCELCKGSLYLLQEKYRDLVLQSQHVIQRLHQFFFDKGQ